MKSLNAILLSVIMAVFVSCAGSQKSESTGQMLDSSALTTKVKTKLLRDKVVDGLDVNVDTFKDTVMLSGFVNSQEAKNRAEKLASNISGVKKVVNNLRVKAE